MTFMKSVSPILIAISIIAAAACGGSKTLTVDEYAAATCGTDTAGDVVEEASTWGEAQSSLSAVEKLLREIDPPEAVRDYHQVVQAAMKILSEIANEQDKNDPVNAFLFFDIRLLALGASMTEAEEKMSDEVRQTMIKHGCFDDADDQS